MTKINGSEKKTHWAWIGQNATTGSPNPRTGRFSMYGVYAAFSTRKLRDNFVDNFYNQSNPSEYTVKCNITTGRGYSLGMPVWHYLDHMKHVEAYEIDEHVE